MFTLYSTMRAFFKSLTLLVLTERETPSAGSVLHSKGKAAFETPIYIGGAHVICLFTAGLQAAPTRIPHGPSNPHL